MDKIRRKGMSGLARQLVTASRLLQVVRGKNSITQLAHNSLKHKDFCFKIACKKRPCKKSGMNQAVRGNLSLDPRLFVAALEMSNAASFAMKHLFPDEASVTKLLKVLDTLIRHSDAVNTRHTHCVTHIKNTR
jgi:hypothetical protein